MLFEAKAIIVSDCATVMALYIICCGDSGDGETLVAESAFARKLVASPTILEEGDIWDCTLWRKGGELGFRLDGWNVGLQILRVKEGSSVDDYNAEADEARRLLKFDFILAVNGVSGTDDMLKVLPNSQNQSPKSGSVQLSILRPQWLSGLVIRKTKTDPLLGLKLLIHEGRSQCAQIQAIMRGGAAADYNEGCAKGMDLRINDFIVSVNGNMDSGEELLKRIEYADTSVELIVLRVLPSLLDEHEAPQRLKMA